MIKLLLCIFAGFFVGLGLLALRQQQTELRYQNEQLAREIEQQQARVWNQQVQISRATSPAAIQQKLDQRPPAEASADAAESVAEAR